MATLHVSVVSAEGSIFEGEAKFVALPGESGELGILPRHTPLITRIKPGAVRILRADNGQEEFVFVAGGILEVQPGTVTVLADTAIRGKDLDEAKATEAKRVAEDAMKNAKSDIDFAKAQGEFAEMAAKRASAPNRRRKEARQERHRFRQGPRRVRGDGGAARGHPQAASQVSTRAGPIVGLGSHV